MIKNNSIDNLEIHISADIYSQKYQTLFVQHESSCLIKKTTIAH